MATLTITTTAAQDSRIVAAFGRILNLKAANGTPRNATGAEVKQAVVDWLKLTVKESEQSQARVQAEAGVTEINPT